MEGSHGSRMSHSRDATSTRLFARNVTVPEARIAALEAKVSL